MTRKELQLAAKLVESGKAERVSAEELAKRLANALQLEEVPHIMLDGEDVIFYLGDYLIAKEIMTPIIEEMLCPTQQKGGE